MTVGDRHEHGRTTCAYWGVNGVNISFFVDFCFLLFFSLRVHRFSPHPDVSFLGFRLIYTLAIPSRSYTKTTSAWENLMTVGESHKHMRESTESISTQIAVKLHSNCSQISVKFRNVERNVDRNVDQLRRCSITRTILSTDGDGSSFEFCAH